MIEIECPWDCNLCDDAKIDKCIDVINDLLGIVEEEEE